MQVAELIQRAQTHTGNAAALAEELGVAFQVVSNWKHGRRTCPPDMRARLAALAGIDPMAELVEGLAEGLSEERRAGLLDALNWRRRSVPNRIREALKAVILRHTGRISHPAATARNLAKPTEQQGYPACEPATQPA